MILLLGIVPAAKAQLADLSPSKQRAANRRALREAKKYPAEYKESHLTVSRGALKRGEPGRPQPRDGRRRYKFDNTGTPRVSEPTAPGVRLMRKKQSPT